jgi:hypothetical protein
LHAQLTRGNFSTSPTYRVWANPTNVSTDLQTNYATYTHSTRLNWTGNGVNLLSRELPIPPCLDSCAGLY